MTLDHVAQLVTPVTAASVLTRNVLVSVVSLMPSVMISVVTMIGIAFHSVWMIVKRTLMMMLCDVVLKIVLIGAIILVLMIVKGGAGLSVTRTDAGQTVLYDVMVIVSIVSRVAV